MNNKNNKRNVYDVYFGIDRIMIYNMDLLKGGG